MQAYLLHRLADEERHAFEARLLEEPDLLRALQRTESELLDDDAVPRTRMRRLCAGCLLAGAVAGALLIEGAHRLFS